MSSERLIHTTLHRDTASAPTVLYSPLTPDDDDILPQPLTLCDVIMYQLEGRHSTLLSELFDTDVVPNAPSWAAEKSKQNKR